MNDCQGDREGRPIGINLSLQIRQKAGRSVGAREDDVGLGGPLWSPAGWGSTRVPPKCQRDEQDAGDPKGPPNPTSAALAPTDVDGLVLRLMPLGRPRAPTIPSCLFDTSTSLVGATLAV